MAEKKMKQWRCKNEHILGFVNWNGDGLPQLMLLRNALDMDVEKPNQVDLLGTLDGRMDVRCSICDDVRLWTATVDTFLAMFQTFNDKQVFEFSQRLLEMSAKILDVNDPAVVVPEVNNASL